MIKGHLGNGAYSKVYFGEDLSNGKGVCIKLNKYSKANQFELRALYDLNKAGFTKFPQVLGHGKVKDESFLVMQRMGPTM